jgi:PAB1-binding protein PBP1
MRAAYVSAVYIPADPDLPVKEVPTYMIYEPEKMDQIIPQANHTPVLASPNGDRMIRYSFIRLLSGDANHCLEMTINSPLSSFAFLFFREH